MMVFNWFIVVDVISFEMDLCIAQHSTTWHLLTLLKAPFSSQVKPKSSNRTTQALEPSIIINELPPIIRQWSFFGKDLHWAINLFVNGWLAWWWRWWLAKIHSSCSSHHHLRKVLSERANRRTKLRCVNRIYLFLLYKCLFNEWCAQARWNSTRWLHGTIIIVQGANCCH